MCVTNWCLEKANLTHTTDSYDKCAEIVRRQIYFCVILITSKIRSYPRWTIVSNMHADCRVESTMSWSRIFAWMNHNCLGLEDKTNINILLFIAIRSEGQLALKENSKSNLFVVRRRTKFIIRKTQMAPDSLCAGRRKQSGRWAQVQQTIIYDVHGLCIRPDKWLR